ncbi:MAG: hypothetical protein ACRETO_00850 [Gammaproteobacteria bacterium]
MPLVFRLLYAGALALSVSTPVLISPGCHSTQISGSQHLPELPREYVDTSYVKPTGKIITVSASGDFQAALDKARPGDVITLQSGAVYTGNFVLPAKSGGDWITVESSATNSMLPKPGNRVSPADAINMPKLEATSGSVLTAAPGANHYRLIGLEIRPGVPQASMMHKALSWVEGKLQDSVTSASGGAPSNAVFLENLVSFGANDTSSEMLPNHIIFDRCYIHGDAVVGARRGIALNASYAAVIDSYLSNFKEVGADSQAILVWNGPGPFKIVNNYLEASGENVMFGGQDPTIPGLVPSDIEIRGNYFAKPLTWKISDPTYLGTPWSIKNLFELKNASRVLVDGNLFEYNWAQSQDGFSILFTVRDQDGTAPWSIVSDVTFTNNVVRHVASGINILGRDNDYESQQAQRILIANNLFDDVGGDWGDGTLLLIGSSAIDVTFRHNTSLQTGTIVFGDGNPDPGFTFTDNITPNNQYGIIGSNTGVGKETLAHYFPGGDVRKNVIVGGVAGVYPPDNYFPKSLSAVGFENLTAHDYSLAGSSSYIHKASDGTAIGADMHRLCTALSSSGQQLSNSVASCGGTKNSEQSGDKI